MRQLNLFEELRATSSNLIQITIDTLNQYAKRYDHWQISYSGGKDSTTLVTLIAHLIDTNQIPKPKSLTVMYVDTRLELPPLQASAIKILEQLNSKGFNTQILTAPLDRRFMVYMLGRGVPPPSNTMRWCTQAIKLTPMQKAMNELFTRHNKKLLSFNGVRLGESAVRDMKIEQRMATNCSKNGSECGQGWYQRDLNDSICDKISPILHWTVCAVWDWLMIDAPALGFDTELLATVYGGDKALELNARTGCICCPLSSKDMALDYLVKLPEWKYLTPLLQLRSLYVWARKFENRHQKVGEKNKNGDFSSAPNRKGPLTLAARKELLEKVLLVQQRVNEVAVRDNRPKIDLINSEEESRIVELIEAKTFPNRWSGDEPIGDAIVPQYDPQGNIQNPLF